MPSKSPPSTKSTRLASYMKFKRAPGESLQAFNKRKQVAKARFIKSRRPSKAAAIARYKKLTGRKAQTRKTPKITRPMGAPITFSSELVTSVRAQWVAGCRISHIAAIHAVTTNAVRGMCHRWDIRPSCIPTAHQVDMFSVMKPLLPEGPKIEARRAVWLQAINDLTVQLLKSQPNKE